MWSDNNIDNAFQRLNPPEPEPTPFPLDAWLRLESQLDEAVIDRAVRRRLWQYFAAEMAAVLLVALGWYLWPAGASAPARLAAPTPIVTAVATALPNRPSIAAVASPAATASVATGGGEVALEALPPLTAPTEHQATVAAPHGLLAVSDEKATETVLRAADGAAAPARANHFSRNARLTEALAVRPEEAGQPAESSLGRTAPVEAASAVEEPLGNSAVLIPAQAATITSTPVSTAASASSAAARQLPITRSVTGRPSQRPVADDAMAEDVRPAGRGRQKIVAAATSPASDTRQPQAAADATSQTASAKAAGPAAPGATVAAAGFATDSRPLHVAAAPPPALVAPEPPAHLAPVPVAPVAGLPRPVRQPRFYVGLVAAPDVSTVKFDGLGKPCLNLGLTLDVRLGNRLRLSTGLLRASKEYVTRRENYDWGAYQARVYSHDFKDVESTCTVVDVPLNLRYDLLVRPSYRLVGTVGLSSLFMQRERYYYDWVDATGSHTWTRSVENQNQHLLRILNLAAGVEYGLGPRWNLLAEPYVKVPLAGVGEGKVKLLSAGVLFGLKYGF